MRVILNWKEKKKKEKKEDENFYTMLLSRTKFCLIFCQLLFLFVSFSCLFSYQEIYFVVENRDKISTNGWARDRLITG